MMRVDELGMGQVGGVAGAFDQDELGVREPVGERPSPGPR